MKFTLSWLKDYLDTDATLEEICEGLIGVGLEVEDVTDKTSLLRDFTVAHVTLAETHPNADKLRHDPRRRITSHAVLGARAPDFRGA